MVFTAHGQNYLEPSQIFKGLTFKGQCAALIVAVESDFERYVYSLKYLHERCSSLKNLKRGMTPTIQLFGSFKKIKDFGPTTHLLISEENFIELKKNLFNNRKVSAKHLEYITVIRRPHTIFSNFDDYEILHKTDCVVHFRVLSHEVLDECNMMKWWRSLLERFRFDSMKRSCYYGSLMDSYVNGAYHRSVAMSLKYEILAAFSYKNYVKNKGLISQGEEAFSGAYQNYEGASGKVFKNFKCIIMKEKDGKWTDIQYTKKAQWAEDEEVARVPIVHIYSSYHEVPDIYPDTAQVGLRNGEICVLDLQHPLSYIHDHPGSDFVDNDSESAHVGCKIVLKESYVSFFSLGLYNLKKGSHVFVNLKKKHGVSDHVTRLSEYEENGWPWASFVLYHRGKVPGMNSDFQVIHYPHSTGKNTWASNILRVKKEGKKGWGVVVVVDLPEGSGVVPYCGSTHSADDIERKCHGRSDFRDYALRESTCTFDVGFGVGSEKCGTIARMVNHSCNGNVLVEFDACHGGYYSMVADRAIKASEFVGFDYGGSKPTEICKCGLSINFHHYCDRKEESLRWVRNHKSDIPPMSTRNFIGDIAIEPSVVPDAYQITEGEALEKDIKVTSSLGKGSYGTCFSCTYKDDGNNYALKGFNFDNKDDFIREILCAQILKESAFFPNVYYKLHYKGKKALLFEKVEGTSLHNKSEILQQGDWRASWLARMQACLCLFEAVSAMHKASIVHNDLHSGNVLMSCEGSRIHIIDFGKAISLDKRTPSNLHAKPCTCDESHISEVNKKCYWMAPESYNCSQHNHFSSDIYGLGFLVVLLLFGDKALKFIRIPENCFELPPHLKSAAHRLHTPFSIVSLIPAIRK